MTNKLKVKIIGTGSYLPSNIVTNENLSTILNTNHEWISTRTGIHERRIANFNQNVDDLATYAVQNALNAANLTIQDLQAIIVTTTTASDIFPSVSIKVQQNLNMHHGFAFDINTVCSGFVYALYVAHQILSNGDINRIAVVGTEIMSRIVDWTDRSTCILFGDGAGAMILESYNDNAQIDTKNNSNIIDILLTSNSSLQDALFAHDIDFYTKNHTLKNIERFVIDKYTQCSHKFGIQMNGNAVYKHAIAGMTQMSTQILQRNNIENINWLLLHQANMRITETVADKLHISSDKIMSSIQEYANTSVATIPITLDKYVKNNMIQRGDIILIATAGAGMTFSSGLIRW